MAVMAGLAVGTALSANISSDNVEANLQETGGSGGQGDGMGNVGGNGGAPSIGTVNGISTGGAKVSVFAGLTAGSGGFGENGANGGNGIAISLTNALSGSTSGRFTFSRRRRAATAAAAMVAPRESPELPILISL